MNDVVQQILIGAAGDGSGGLAAEFVVALLRTAGKLVRERFGTPERTSALQRAVAAAFTEALDAWAINVDETAHYCDLFKTWLLNPTVLSEFRSLLTPVDSSVLDSELLRAEFEDSGLSADYLGTVSFDVLLQDMVGAFYHAAAEEPALQEPIKIDLLRQMAQRMGALDRLMQRQTRAGEMAVDHLAAILAEIRRLAQEQARGQDNTNTLQQQILQVLTETMQRGSASQQLVAYQQSELALTTAGLLSDADGPSATNGEREQALPALQSIRTMLAQIHRRLTAEGGRPSAETLAALEERYRQTLINQFEHLTFEGLQPSGVPIVLPLEKVYVELKAVVDVPEAADTYSAEERRLLLEAEGRGSLARQEVAMHLDALRVERWNRQARQAAERVQRRSIEELLHNPTHRGVVILGDPGSGKTTLLRYQALCAAQGKEYSTVTPRPLPIFVPLAAYDAYLQRSVDQCSLGDFLAIYYDKWHSLPGLAPLFQQALETGSGVVLLDGLDEVLDEARRQFVAEQAGALIRQWTSRGNRFALTSRIVGYREARLPVDLPHVTVLDFGQTEIARFAHQWCRAYESWVAGGETVTALQRAAAEERALLGDIRSNASVERLAASPLLLTMLALLRRHVGKLPDRRIDLYASYVRTLLDNWQLARSRGARQHVPERFDPHTAIEYLIELAFWLQQHKPTGTARRQELEQILEHFCLRLKGREPMTAPTGEWIQARQEAERFLRDMRHFAGLLAERGRDAFGFLHLTFQEYFAGRALARMDPEQRWAVMVPNLHRPRWREPILLCAGQLGVMEQRRDQVNALACRILEAGSAHEDILHRDLFLLAALAADDVGLSPALFDELTSRLALLQESAVPTVRDTALAGLAQLTRLGHEQALARLEESLHKPHLQIPAIHAVKVVIEAEACTPLRQAISARLDNANWDVRWTAVTALAGLVATDSSVRQAISACLDDADSNVRQAAVTALAGLVATDSSVRQAISACLDDADSNVRQAAVTALAGLVATDSSVRQAISACLDDADSNVRQAAVTALAGLVATDSSVRQAISACLDDADSNVRQAAVTALAGLVATDSSVRQAISACLDDADSNVRRAAVTALAGLVATDSSVRQAISACLDDADSNVRRAAVTALAGLVATDSSVRQAISACLDDADSNVRRAAVTALAGLVGSNDAITQRLLPWLGTVAEFAFFSSALTQIRRLLATTYAPILVHQPDLLAQVAEMLTSHAWPMRQGAAWTLIAMPDGPPPHLRPALLGLLDDSRGEESWPERLQVCEILINSHDRDLSQHAIALALDALDYATQPWYDLPHAGARVREYAARILGQLDPIYQDERIFTRLVRVLKDDTDARVRDASYGALLRLAAAPEQESQKVA